MLIALDLLTVFALLGGVCFMLLGALGLVRLPDLYHRMHAGSKCITLGIAGMLLAVVFHLGAVSSGGAAPADGAEGSVHASATTSVVGAITKAILVIIFQFVGAPVAAHMLARAAHMDGLKQWEGTLSDELAEDAAKERA